MVMRWEGEVVVAVWERGVVCLRLCSLWYCREIGRACVGCGGLGVVAVVDAAVGAVVVVGLVLGGRRRGGCRRLTSNQSCGWSGTVQRRQHRPIGRRHWERLAHCGWPCQSAAVAEKVAAIVVGSASEHCQAVQCATVACTFDVLTACIGRTCRDA
jgi:hypothetical protein